MMNNDRSIIIPIDNFDVINRKFKKCSIEKPLQMIEFYQNIIKTINVQVEMDSAKNIGQELIKILKEKLLHLSYTYNLWDYCLYWDIPPIVKTYCKPDKFETIFVAFASIVIYKESHRIKI